jgi:hypothetical protein
MTISNIRDHPYHFEQALSNSLDYNKTTTTTTTTTSNFTWLVFINAKWVPFASSNQHKLEQTLGLGGTFVDIEDRLFPAVKRVRVFPKANYLSYLGVKYRLSRVMQPHYEINDRYYELEDGDELVEESVSRLLPSSGFILSPLTLGGGGGGGNSSMNNNSSSSSNNQHQQQQQQQQQQQRQQQRRPITSRVS